jgi:hypothetical protein
VPQRTIKLMTDYHCQPLWDVEKSANLMPNELSLSQATINKLQKWTQDYDNTLNAVDPSNSGFSSPEKELSFEKEGRSLWLQLIVELGSNYNIHYFSNKYQKVVESPEEYDALEKT